MNTRLGALGGFTFLVLGWASMGLVPQPPGATATATEWIDWYDGSAGGIQATAFLAGIVVLALLVWFGGMRQRVWRGDDSAPWGPIATVGFALLATGQLVGAGLTSVVAMRLDELGPDLVVFSSVLVGVLYAFGQFGVAAVMGAISAEAQRTGALPRWLVVLGWAGAATSVATGAGMATENEAVMGAIFLAWIFVSVWIAGCSVVLWKGAPVAERSEAPAAGRSTPVMSGLG